MHIELKNVCRLRLKTLLGFANGAEAEIPDPFDASKTIIVRDAQVLGHLPIVEGERTEAEYIDALVTRPPEDDELLPVSDINKICDQLHWQWSIGSYAPVFLETANLKAIEQFYKPGLCGEPDTEAARKAAQKRKERLLKVLELNQQYALVQNEGTVVVVQRSTMQVFSTAEAAKIEKNRPIYNDEDKKVSAFEFMMSHPARVYYGGGMAYRPRGLDHHGRPARDLDTKFNLWREPELEAIPGDCSLLVAHIHKIICRGRTECSEYVLNWLAHLIQKPHEKPGVAIVAYGKKRTGKGTVADAICDILGRKLAETIVRKDHIVGRFSNSTRPPLFTQIEEALYSGNGEHDSILKSLITEPTEMIELKGKQTYQVESVRRMWFNSNSDKPVPVTGDEMRYLILRICPSRAGDRAYFKALRNEMYHNGGLEAFVDMLLWRNIEDFDVGDVPLTEEFHDMVFKRLPKQARAIADILYEGRVALVDPRTGEACDDIELREHSPTWVPKKLVHTVLNASFKRYGESDSSAIAIRRHLFENEIISDRELKTDARRNQVASYEFLPTNEVVPRFAEEHDIDDSLLRGGNVVEVTPADEAVNAIQALDSATRHIYRTEDRRRAIERVRQAVRELAIRRRAGVGKVNAYAVLVPTN